MKKLTTLMIVFISLSLQGQVWIDQGATWHYDWSGTLPAFSKIEYIGDTVINNKSCQQLEVRSYMFSPIEVGAELHSENTSYEYTYANGDTVFYLVNDEFQEYHPLVEDGNVWNVMQETGGPGPIPNLSTNTFAIAGDTTINQVDYKKLYSSTQEEPTEWTLEWAIREDMDRKVYIWSFTFMQEWLMYDFAAAVGDTFLILPNDPDLYLVMDSISSIDINGSTRAKYWLTAMSGGTPYSNEPETWIEGIGSNKGIVFSGTSVFTGAAHWLLCKWENGEQIYMNPDYNSCYIATVSVGEISGRKLKLYPNPATSLTWLQLPENTLLAQAQIELYSPTGRLLYKARPTNQFHKLEVAHLPKGLYLVRLWDRKGWLTEKLAVR